MRIEVAFGPKAGEVLHVPRDQNSLNMIASGYWKALEDLKHPSADPNDRQHTIPPKILRDEWWIYRNPATPQDLCLRARLRRNGGETVTYFGSADPQSRDWQGLLRFIQGSMPPPESVRLEYEAARNFTPPDPIAITDAREKEKRELEAEMKRQDLAAKIFLVRGGVE